MPSPGPTLTPRQQVILAWLRDEPDHKLTLAAIATRAGQNPDAARRMMERLAERRLVIGKGRGTDRVFKLSGAGEKAIGDRSPDGMPEPAARAYTVLARRSVLELFRQAVASASDPGVDPEQPGLELEQQLGQLEVFEVLTEVESARNTEDAFRQAIKASALHHDEPVLVAVSTRYWQPTPLRVTRREFVEIG